MDLDLGVRSVAWPRILLLAVLLSACASPPPPPKPAAWQVYAQQFENVTDINVAVSGIEAEAIAAVADAVYGAFARSRNIPDGETLSISMSVDGEPYSKEYGYFGQEAEVGYAYEVRTVLTWGDQRTEQEKSYRYAPKSIEVSRRFNQMVGRPLGEKWHQDRSARQGLTQIFGALCNDAVRAFGRQFPRQALLSQNENVSKACLEWYPSEEGRMQIARHVLRDAGYPTELILRASVFLGPHNLQSSDFEMLRGWFDGHDVNRRRVANRLYFPCPRMNWPSESPYYEADQAREIKKYELAEPCWNAAYELRLSRVHSGPAPLRVEMLEKLAERYAYRDSPIWLETQAKFEMRQQVTEQLAQLTRDSDPKIRAAAVVFTDHTRLLDIATGDEDSDVRIAAVELLTSIEALDQISRTDKRYDVRKAAYERCRRQASRAAIASPSDSDPTQRCRAP